MREAAPPPALAGGAPIPGWEEAPGRKPGRRAGLSSEWSVFDQQKEVDLVMDNKPEKNPDADSQPSQQSPNAGTSTPRNIFPMRTTESHHPFSTPRAAGSWDVDFDPYPPPSHDG